ncbi:MAG: protein-L-isoaspartate(D-aspartate) O-methyltransferase [Xanthomonadales bacterium]|jgi:protein-L-isoaspartate(D-aspartate) O-methyltransferase|nr:protein-L-isoaspartate(D-aspartate) O-methyltransferase [Xanthomonadales bacterium]
MQYLNLMGRVSTLLLLFLAAWLTVPTESRADEFTAQRAALIGEIRTYARLDHPPGLSESVLQAMMRVRRHEFVPAASRSQAYRNHPLPIGYGQTISQPYIVALMTDLLELSAGDTVLEIGTGSGYQAAVLAELVDRVYSIEIVEPLANQVKERLSRLGYENVTTRLGDGYYGWEEHAPFDAIVVTAAASHVPPPLIAQLKPGGRMVIPVGGQFMTQYLLLIAKDKEGEVTSRQITAVRFVPLTGSH